MGRLSEIKTEIGALLSAITTGNGYSFTFGTVNPADRAKILAWPAANIMLKSEAPTSTSARYHGYDICQVEIELFVKMDAVNTNPLASMDASFDTVLSAIKKKVRADNGHLPITGSATIAYTGWRREVSVSGDVFQPYRMIITCEVLYNSNE
jgi:hypothetical protein